MYRLKRIEVVELNTSGARQTTSTFTVKKAPYPELTAVQFHVRRALRKYLNEHHKGMSNLIFKTKKDRRIVKVVTNKEVFYL